MRLVGLLSFAAVVFSVQGTEAVLARKPSASTAVLRTVVHDFRFEGNTVFSDAELTTVLEPYLGLRTGNELLDARDAVTAHYQSAGFVTSGAHLPDQNIQDGVVLIRIVEGRLSGVEIEGDTHFDPDYLRSRLLVDGPLDIGDLRERVELLTRDPYVRKLDARLEPGAALGEARLAVEVDDEPRFGLFVESDNYRSPAIGAERVDLHAYVANLLGRSDELNLWQEAYHEFGNRQIAYSVPVTAADTRLLLEYERSDARVEAEPFNQLDIESEFERFSVFFTHPVLRRRDESLFLSLGMESRLVRTFLLGQPFDFSPGVREDGRAKVVVVRFGQDWVRRSARDVLAVSSQFSLGLDWLGATVNDKLPDGRFFVWLGQAQWLRRLDWRDAQILVRASAQISSDALLPSEKLAIGGRYTVRGYREATLTRDNSVLASVELRVPVGRVSLPGVTNRAEEGTVQVAGFVDYGRGWEKSRGTPAPRDLSSVGLGVLWSPADEAHLELYWGVPLREVSEPRDWDLQDAGVHFGLSFRVF